MLFFFFNDTATTEIYTLSLHDALPIFNDKFEGKRSKLITDDLERKYNLIPSSKVGEKGVTEMPKVDIGKGNIKEQVASVVRMVLKHYRFCSLGELNAILSAYNLAVEEVKK